MSTNQTLLMSGTLAAGIGEAESLVSSNPLRAIAILETFVAASPQDARVPRAEWLKVNALVKLERIGDARVAAEAFFERFPNDPHQRRIESLTGAHPRRVGPPKKAAGASN